MAMRSKKNKRPTREKRQNDRRKRNERSIELRRQLDEAKKELERLKQEQRQQWMRQKELNRLMRLERRERCFEREGKQPQTNSTDLVRQKSNQRKKKQIDWAPVNDWNKKFDDVVVDSERTRTIRWL